MKLFGREYDDKTKHKIYYIFGIKISKKDKLEILKTENAYLKNAINQIGADKLPAATGELRQWQLELLELLKTFDKICRENNVQYWLDFGTLLGAVRHKGFIPWDDDIDISMLKSDVDKILPVLKEYFKNSDFIVRERALTCNNFQIRVHHKKYNLGFDIFQVYSYPEKNLTAELRHEITNKIINARKIFDKKYSAKYMNEKQLKQALNGRNEIHEKYIAPINCTGSILIHGIEYPYLKNEYVINSDLIFPLNEAEFEGYKLYVPNKSEEYLSTLWKNWRDVPSEVGIYEHYTKNYKEDEK